MKQSGAFVTRDGLFYSGTDAHGVRSPWDEFIPSWVVHRDAGPVAVAIRIVIVEWPVEEQELRHIDNRECDALGISGNR